MDGSAGREVSCKVQRDRDYSLKVGFPARVGCGAGMLGSACHLVANPAFAGGCGAHSRTRGSQPCWGSVAPRWGRSLPGLSDLPGGSQPSLHRDFRFPCLT